MLRTVGNNYNRRLENPYGVLYSFSSELIDDGPNIVITFRMRLNALSQRVALNLGGNSTTYLVVNRAFGANNAPLLRRLGNLALKYDPLSTPDLR